MSLRDINKDHLAEHRGLELVPGGVPLPDFQDPLKFWTHHPKEPTLADLTVFAEGERANPTSGKWAGPFTGRPHLIRQLMPAIQSSLTAVSRASVGNCISSLRVWWRILDAVELAAEQARQPMARVEDVRQLTRAHADFAYGNGQWKARHPNRTRHFLRLVNLTLRSLGEPELHWAVPEGAKVVRRLPPEDQTTAIRIRLKQKWYEILRFWALMDRIRNGGFKPATNEEARLLVHWQHFTKVQQRCGTALPSAEELRNGLTNQGFRYKTGLTLTTMRLAAFPDRRQADTAFYLCLAHTGWNPATLYSLDASRAKDVLRDHPRDPSRYLLTGTKARAGGAEQPVEGLWKTKAGPGYIIKAWMQRTELLRGQLETMLAAERTKYRQMTQDGAGPEDLASQLKSVQRLEEGCRSVWLFAGEAGIGWLTPRGNQTYHGLDGHGCDFLTAFINQVNRERADRGEPPIQRVTASDFRDIFAVYVWRVSGGNIFAVMWWLKHRFVRTTEGYVDTHILNQERDEQARTFVHHLLDLLGAGRFDVTILAHLQRYGAVTQEMERRLAEYRALQRSRVGIACKDPFHPPSNIQPESDDRVCRPQRCLLCKHHAVILPESMDGVAMRVTELETIKTSIPVEAWSDLLAEELRNGLDVLKLFPCADVRNARERWSKAIEIGRHHVPGLHPTCSLKETA